MAEELNWRPADAGQGSSSCLYANGSDLKECIHRHNLPSGIFDASDYFFHLPSLAALLNPQPAAFFRLIADHPGI
jgi:hypothetical protein